MGSRTAPEPSDDCEGGNSAESVVKKLVHNTQLDDCRMWYVYVPYKAKIRHLFVVSHLGAAVHLWIDAFHGSPGFGGIEFHYPEAPSYMAGRKPDHDPCWILGKPCWHDGSALAAEKWILRWEELQKDHVELLDKFYREYLGWLKRYHKERTAKEENHA